MPVTEASNCTPASAAMRRATMPAEASAVPMTTSGTSHSQGLRYVMSRRTATTMTVVSSSVKSAPSNTAAMSTSKPSGPVRYVRTPSRPSEARVRISAARSLCAETSASGARGTTSSATVPSSDTWAGGMNPSGVRETRSPNAFCWIAATVSAGSFAPSSDANTSRAEVVSASGNVSRMFCTCTDSAESGSPEPGAVSEDAPEPRAKRAATPAKATTSTIQDVRAEVRKRRKPFMVFFH